MNEPTTGMRNYIPTDADVRNRYGMGVWWELNDSSGDARADFDRWLAERDRKVKAQAWEEGHNEPQKFYINGDRLPADNPYRQGEN